MTKLLAITILPALAVGLMAASEPTPSNTHGFVITRHSLTEACSDHAKLAGEGLMAPTIAVSTCTAALEEEAVTPSDLAATRNNRGVVRLTIMGEVEDARLDFEAAAQLDPECMVMPGITNRVRIVS